MKYWRDVSIAVVATLILYFIGIGRDSSNIYAPQNMSGSAGAVQIQGNGNVVYKAPVFTWTNKDTWLKNQGRSNYPEIYPPTEYNKVILEFSLEDLTLSTSEVCLNIRTKTRIFGYIPDSDWFGPSNFNFNPPDKYNFCFKTVSQKKIVVGLYSEELFHAIDAELVSS
jgi:hypothetical protein